MGAGSYSRALALALQRGQSHAQDSLLCKLFALYFNNISPLASRMPFQSQARHPLAGAHEGPQPSSHCSQAPPTPAFPVMSIPLELPALYLAGGTRTF